MAIVKECVIYDFETLSQDPYTGPILSFSILFFNMENVIEGKYSQEGLLESCNNIKFDISEQINKYSKRIDPSTWDWWKELPKDVREKQLKPSKKDVSIDKLGKFINNNFELWKSIGSDYPFGGKINNIYSFSRGNTFDPMFLKVILETVGGKDPFSWSKIRDTRSFIDSLLLGTNIQNNFIPKCWDPSKIGLHNPNADIVLDILRMQTILSAGE